MTAPACPALLTVPEVAAVLHVSRMTVYRYVHGGELEALRIGKSVRVTARGLRAYLDRARP